MAGAAPAPCGPMCAISRATPRNGKSAQSPNARRRRRKRASPKAANTVAILAGSRRPSTTPSRTGWTAREDRRHFRLILSAENGARIGDLQAYTRDVMDRAEQALGMRLDWVAIDHWDTDNPHTHIILRGRTPDGRDLVIPRDYVSHGFRSAARDAATDRLGARGRDDARLALERDALVHGPSRLDGMIAGQLDEERRVRLARLKAPDRSPETENALKARAQELKRLGLAVEVERNVFQFEPGWRDALKAMELHLDIRKALVRARTQDLQRQVEQTQKLARALRLGPDR